MAFDPDMRPKLRPIEAFPVPEAGPGMIGLRDPSGLSPAMLTVSDAVVFILGHFDGTHTLREVSERFARQFHQALPPDRLDAVVSQLQGACLLDDETFDAHYRQLVESYRARPARVMDSAGELGIDGDIGRVFDQLLAAAGTADGSEPIAGVVAPHLDYPRGAPCYAAAYAPLRDRPVPERIVILGTNHFGRSTTAVTTSKCFQTPLGTSETDEAFIGQLEARCGDLRASEFDHQREHSVELQLLWCQHLFGAEAFQLVPVLCPDPCGPTGTRPHDGAGVDLADFAAALAACIGMDGKDTLLIAGADLSHVGAHFGDDRPLDDAFLPEVQSRDEAALRALREDGPDAFVACVARDDNPTRICSAGCLFTLRSVLPEAKVHLLKYHQAIHEPSQTGVTCAAMLFTQ
jgi:AmmeMemoRadiSam system protein B